LIHSY